MFSNVQRTMYVHTYATLLNEVREKSMSKPIPLWPGITFSSKNYQPISTLGCQIDECTRLFGTKEHEEETDTKTDKSI